MRYLEHVELKTSINYTTRGALEVYLTSPTGKINKIITGFNLNVLFVIGTKVQLLNTRLLDKSEDGFQNWTFMSVMTWGEIPTGLWILTITDNVSYKTNELQK